ncbi:hypothetical protein M0R04_07765 [Candidatus Dojkabacteria bacterium]|jgi:hypothetical protein|nr:hypothetical protein [Candidatus Dojkabacteria bacterium]
MTLEQYIKQIQETSSVSKEDQEVWLTVSESAIAEGEVEKLSIKGLMQVVSQIAYRIITDSHIGVQLNMSDEEFVIMEEKVLPAQNEIVEVASLGSGIHPEVIEEMIDIRCEYYSELYCKYFG